MYFPANFYPINYLKPAMESHFHEVHKLIMMRTGCLNIPDTRHFRNSTVNCTQKIDSCGKTDDVTKKDSLRALCRIFEIKNKLEFKIKISDFLDDAEI